MAAAQRMCVYVRSDRRARVCVCACLRSSNTAWSFFLQQRPTRINSESMYCECTCQSVQTDRQDKGQSAPYVSIKSI